MNPGVLITINSCKASMPRDAIFAEIFAVRRDIFNVYLHTVFIE